MENIKATLSEFLTTDEIIEPSSPNYGKETQVWAAHRNLYPKLVVRPKTVESLSALLKTLNETDIEFAVRGGGCGSTSTRGVLVSMSAFDGFEFNKEEETVTVGAGQLWRHVDAKVEEFAPGYSGKQRFVLTCIKTKILQFPARDAHTLALVAQLSREA